MNQDDAKKQAFHNDMINLYKRTHKELKYKSTKLLDMINKYGGYEAAIKFIISESNKFDFTVLWENERLDLSVESLITNIKYRELFSDEILSFCDKKLKDYNFSPKKIIEEKTDNIDQMLKDVFEELNEINPPTMQTPSHKEYPLYTRPIDISKEMWKELFSNNAVFTEKNKDLVLRMYLIEGYVESEDISAEEGYNNKYPYKEVVMALAKRIKAKVKIEVPKSRKGEILWWHLLFFGGFKDNTNFEWCVRPELKMAIAELVSEGKIDITPIEVKTHKEVEELPIDQIEEPISIEEPTAVEEKVVIEEPAPMTVEDSVEDNNSLDSFIDSLMSEEPSAIKSQKTEKKEVVKKTVSTKQEIISEPKVSQQIVLKSTDDFIDSLFGSVEEKVIDKKVEPSQVEAPSINTNQVAEVGVEETKQQVSDEELKKACIEYYGAICEICGFDYGYTYGETFENKIGIHHVHGGLEEKMLLGTDPVQDLIPVCHNCHLVIHSKTPSYTVDEMRVMLKNAH